MNESDFVDEALKVLGGEKTDFWLTAVEAKPGVGAKLVVALRCCYEDCTWGLAIHQMELWEFITAARVHWEDEHAGKPC